ncbi:MAG: type II secretion system secretin GspD [Luteimonas sp.]
MNFRRSIHTFLLATLVTVLAACASTPTPTLSRAPAAVVAPAQQQGTAGAADRVAPQALPDADADGPRAQIRRGSGQTINRAAAASPPPSIGGSSGEASFNFEGESLQAVVKAILGDMLGQNYVIAPGVQGTVTLATPKPVSPASALALLEMVLGWNNARMIYADSRYSIVPADQALATGTVPTRTGATDGVRGFESRVVPLKYISATEMEKVLKPYARPNAIVSVDSGRNVITVAGTRSELDNYLRTIGIFDVDWMSSMSVGVFPLKTGKASKVVADLEKVFGEQSKSPVAGLFRFLPLDGANAVLAITTQPDYLDDIQDWIERIDGAGAGEQLFTYELKYITAKDLATNLAQVYGGKSSGGSGDAEDGGGGASLIPGAREGSIDGSGSSFESSQLGGTESGGLGGSSGSGSGSSTGGLGSGSLSLGARQGGNTTVSLEVNGDKVGVAAVDETNSLIVRASGTAWQSIKEVIEKLDVMPMQVHIEAQVVQVTLSGALTYGVNWFFERAVTDAGLPNAVGRTTWSGLAGNISGTATNGVPAGLGWTFLGRNAAAIINALDTVTDLKMLATPSVFVRNNTEATFNVGTRIPIESTSINSTFGGTGAVSNVQYIDTGTILKVRPRVTKDGLVFLDVVQEISSAGDIPSPCTTNCNPRISTRRLKTAAAVQDGTTVIMAGLIDDTTTRGSRGLPGLSRIPIIGGLFGQQNTSTTRNETIIFLTPTIVRDPKEAIDLTDEYSRRFRAMEPLQSVEKK